jgi:Spy/CpxP family protein refolding chaperone
MIFRITKALKIPTENIPYYFINPFLPFAILKTKKPMKKHLAIACLSLLLASGSYAQENNKMNGQSEHSQMTPDQKAEKRTKYMTEKLSLSADQSAQIKAIILKNQGIKQTDQAEMKKMRMQMDADINNVLNPEQQAKYKALKDEKKAEMQQHKMEEGKKSDKK